MGLTCYCESYCPDVSKFNGTCEGEFCFSAVELVYDTDASVYKEHRTFGCLSPVESGLMQCRSYLTKHARPKNISCCREYDQCNSDLYPELIFDEETDSSARHNIISYNILIVLCVLFFLVSALIFWNVCKKRIINKIQLSKKYFGHSGTEFRSIAPKAPPDLYDQSSGSGSGSAKLVQRTIGKQIHMMRIIGKGRYGEVSLGKWRGDFVAVKVFSTTDEASWLREKEIYQTALLTHENILGYIGADIRSVASCTQMLLITDYHEMGSLYDYLKSCSIDYISMFKMCCSIASGISHLHTEIFGAMAKPAIAHRDIKSKNILVKTNGDCCIADFGLAVKYDSKNEVLDVGNNPKVGTKRYMAPEVLDGSINVSWFESLKRADIYSLSLVLWEICRRCEICSEEKYDKATEYQLPYFDCVPSDPSIEDMFDVVCVKGLRPQISPMWDKNDTMKEISKLLTECWNWDPSARLTALRIKYSLSKIRMTTLNKDKLGVV